MLQTHRSPQHPKSFLRVKYQDIIRVWKAIPMNNPKQQLSHAQRKLIDSFIANAGLEYVGKRFSLSRRGKNKTRYFSCERVEFAQEISDSELLSLAQQGYLQVYAD